MWQLSTTNSDSAAISPPCVSIVRSIYEYANRHHTEWSVCEIDCTHIPGARAARCLLFDSEFVMRRVYDFPQTWFALSDAELLAVSWRR